MLLFLVWLISFNVSARIYCCFSSCSAVISLCKASAGHAASWIRLNNWVKDQPWRSSWFMLEGSGNWLCRGCPLVIDIFECLWGDVAYYEFLIDGGVVWMEIGRVGIEGKGWSGNDTGWITVVSGWVMIVPMNISGPDSIINTTWKWG